MIKSAQARILALAITTLSRVICRLFIVKASIRAFVLAGCIATVAACDSTGETVALLGGLTAFGAQSPAGEIQQAPPASGTASAPGAAGTSTVSSSEHEPSRLAVSVTRTVDAQSQPVGLRVNASSHTPVAAVETPSSGRVMRSR